MGTKERELLKSKGIKLNELIQLLNKALSDEWLAYYQYWVGAKVAVGVLREQLVTELVEHANEELEHAEKIATRILQLGGTPVLEPKEWYKLTNCGYSAPKNSSIKAILEQNIKGEQCAIQVYNDLLEYVKGKDVETFHMICSILRDEMEHEEDLENLKRDLVEG